MASKKYRNFSAVMYEQPDIKNVSAQRWAYILHDKDIEKDGSLKKAHYHILLEFVNPRSVSSVAKMLGIAENMVEIVYSVEGSRLYLTHANAPDKTQYDVSEVVANYDLENVDKPLSFLALYDMCEKNETFKDFIEEISTYRIPQSLSTFNMLVSIWRNRPI
uniref:Replication protein n=1 Tax=Dulem virus 75 TaxID=3145786 RepID=A0AAU8B7J5_9VIRU